MVTYANWQNWSSVNVAAGSPATEKYPGAVDPQVYTEDYPAPFPIQGPNPAAGVSPYGAQTPPAGSGGGIIDTTYLTGTDAPEAVWDSAGGTAVTPNLSYPGALPPNLHEDDGSGAVAAAQTVVAAAIGKLIRKTPTGQTYNRDYAFEPVNGQLVPSANGRVDFDQIQEWDPAPGDGGGYAPWEVPYAERPVLLNVAYQQTPVTNVGNQYGVNGFLPDRSQWNSFQAETYAAPPDPVVNQSPAPAASSMGTGWLPG